MEELPSNFNETRLSLKNLSLFVNLKRMKKHFVSIKRLDFSLFTQKLGGEKRKCKQKDTFLNPKQFSPYSI